jgi:hypothetical protein
MVAGPVVVPDASVLLKWVLRTPDEEGPEPSLAVKSAWMQGAIEIVVPTLWVYEWATRRPEAAGRPGRFTR